MFTKTNLTDTAIAEFQVAPGIADVIGYLDAE